MAATSLQGAALRAATCVPYEAARLRLAGLRDAGALAELARCLRPGADITAESVREWLEQGGALVLEHPETGSIVSFLRWRELPDGWRIDPVATLPDYQSQGYGRWLMTKLEALAIRRNIPNLSLELGPEDDERQGYYERMGYRPAGDASGILQKRVGGTWQVKR